MLFNMDSDLCRLCGKNHISLMNLFKNHIESDVCHKIRICFGVQIKEDDPITKKICKSCYFFTNSVYEYRLNCIEHDLKIKRDYAESVKKFNLNTSVPPINYPSTQISQDAFLNSLNLTNKSDSKTIEKPFIHYSITKLKRKFPKITIPVACNKIDLDPFVLIETVPNKFKSTQNKRSRILRSDMIANKIPKDQDVTKESSLLKSKSNVQTETKAPSKILPPRKKIKRSSGFYKRKGKAKRRKVLEQNSEKIENRSNGDPNKSSSPQPDDASSNLRNIIDSPVQHISANVNLEKENYRKTIKNLIQSDVNSANTLFKFSTNSNNNDLENECSSRVVNPPDNNDSLVTANVNTSTTSAVEDNNLLMTVGQEIQTFICQTCNKVFDTLILLNNHKKYNHKSSLRCSKCSKRFSVVEALVKHNLQYHSETAESLKEKDETNSETNNSETNNSEINHSENTIVTDNNVILNKIIFASTSQARKRTHGILNRSSNIFPIESDQQEHYNISSDEDIEITGITSEAVEKSTSQLRKLLTEGEPDNAMSKKDQTELGVLNKDFNIDLTYDEDVFLIDDSDNETVEESDLNSKQATNETSEIALPSTSIVVDDDSNSHCADSNDNTADKHDNAAKPENGVKETSPTSDSSIKHKMTVVLSNDDNKKVKTSIPNSEKLSYELNYVNYILNKYNFENTSKGKFENTWLLEGIKALPSNVYLPIELTKSNEDCVSVEYGYSLSDLQTNKSSVWDLKNVIDMPKAITSNQEKNSSKNSPNNEKGILEKVTQSINPNNQNPVIVSTPKIINVTSNSHSGGQILISGVMNNNIPVASTTQTTNPVLPTMSVPPLVVSNVECTQNLLNFALQNAASKYTQQRNQVRQYSGPATKFKSIESAPVVVNQTPFQPVTSSPSFILMGVSPSQTNARFNRNYSLKPAILNVSPLPTVSSNEPYAVRDLGQTNVNIQNCVSINQQEFRTSVTNLVGQYTTPFVFQEQLGVVSTSASLQPIPTTSNLTVSTAKPTIRIKNLSELRDNSFNANQTNQLHSLYSEKLISLAAKQSSVMAEHTTADEYIQIS